MEADWWQTSGVRFGGGRKRERSDFWTCGEAVRFYRFSGEEPREEGERSEALEWRSRKEIGKKGTMEARREECGAG